MEEVTKVLNSDTNYICEKLQIIANVLDKTDWIELIFTAFVSIFSVYLGYWIASRNEKKSIYRNDHIKYLEFTNDFLSEVNSIIIELVNLQKMGFILMGWDKNPTGSDRFFYGNLKDYNSVIYKIRELRKEIDKIIINENTYTSIKEYKENYIKQSNDILSFNKFIEICSVYQKKAANYYYLIDKDLRKEHAYIINKIAKATRENLVNFSIEELKLDLVNHIIHINSKIIGKKIKEPNWFNSKEKA